MSKFSTLLVPILNEILVKEIGEANIPPLKWRKIDGEHYEFEIDVFGKGWEETVEVFYSPLWLNQQVQQYYLPPQLWNSEKCWNVAYIVGGTDTQFTKSNVKVLLQILSTVVDIIKNFISSKEPDALYILATEKDGDKIQKSSLYEAYIKKLLSQIPNYYPESRRRGTLLIKK
jgi:hypothetical protein